MRTRFVSILAGMALLFSACEKNPDKTVLDYSFGVYSREGVAPVTLSAGHGTRTGLGEDSYIVWNKGDVISLINENGNDLELLNAKVVQEMKVGEKKSILLVNPARNGCFLGYNGTQRVRNSDGFDKLATGGADAALSNLDKMAGFAENLRGNSDYVFTLERVDNGWLLYHKLSGIGLTASVVTSFGDSNCVLGKELAVVDIEDGSSNGGVENAVTGREEQIWIRKKVNPISGYLLWSGGKGTMSLGWRANADAWTTWLFYEIPENGFPFTADASGVTTTFTNTTGFTEGGYKWYAVYPESASPAFDEGKLTFLLPQTQAYQPGSFADGANVSLGVLEGTSVSFHSVCGVLELSVKGEEIVQSISVRDRAGKNLWGLGSVSVSSIESGDCSAVVDGGSDLVILNCGSGVQLQADRATEFYIVVPEGAFTEGFDIEIVTPSGRYTRSTTKDNTIKRADIKKMPVFTVVKEYVLQEVSVENKAVSTYMSYGPYEKFGDSSSFLSTPNVRSLKSTLDPNADKPAGYTVSWETSATAASITVTEDGSTWYKEDGITGGTYTITNLTPGRTYSYRVDENGSLVAEGEFKAIGQVRMVSITDAWNCRDLGGWTGLDGATIKYGKLFRTASLNGQFLGTSNTSDSDYADPNMYVFRAQEDIARLGIKAELDLRGDPYSGISGEWGSEGTDHSASLLFTRIEGADFMRIMTDWGLIYPTQRSSLVQDVAWIIKELRLGKPVAYHCRIGADRTGGVSYLIEGLLGVPEGDIARDYELTSFSSKSGWRYAYNPNQTFFKQSMSFVREGKTFQERCYYYLNTYFEDVHINADDLDWFICEMLGLDSYKHPELAKNYEDNSLDAVVSIMTGSGSPEKP